MKVITVDTTNTQLTTIVTTSIIGEIIKLKGDYETLATRLINMPNLRGFSTTDILPGTSNYALYGPNHLIVQSIWVNPA